ncbi:hypothetical protein T190607A01A_30123 [Tenacibaculum sp. 190524A05c]|uniref:Uncharacterized protein n=1 Tax=Tenacibaculum platacis TaxID=3137852 RepID=A0ABP1ERH5_9FLAO
MRLVSLLSLQEIKEIVENKNVNAISVLNTLIIVLSFLF